MIRKLLVPILLMLLATTVATANAFAPAPLPSPTSSDGMPNYMHLCMNAYIFLHNVCEECMTSLTYCIGGPTHSRIHDTSISRAYYSLVWFTFFVWFQVYHTCMSLIPLIINKWNIKMKEEWYKTHTKRKILLLNVILFALQYALIHH